MKLFIIHRFTDRKKAKATLKRIARQISSEFSPVFLDSSGATWKLDAEAAIDCCEAVIVFDRLSCEESENAKWEIDKATSKGKIIVPLDNEDDASSIAKLKSLYELEEEFEECFSSNSTDTLNLYKLITI